MFCPNCGIDDKEPNQFCRACGTNLRPIRTAVETPDSVTLSAISARDEIGRSVAAKIREMKTAKELARVTEDVLPEIEKFLESPEEKRLRRLRAGTIVSAVGIGAAIALSIAAALAGDPGFYFIAGLGGVTFFLGLGIILNALVFTIPKKLTPDRTVDAESQRSLDASTRDLKLPDGAATEFASVTEHTTKHLQRSGSTE